MISGCVRLGDIADHDCPVPTVDVERFCYLRLDAVAGTWTCPECRSLWVYRKIKDQVLHPIVIRPQRYTPSSRSWRRSRRKEMQG